jgi:hypothetical protein
LLRVHDASKSRGCELTPSSFGRTRLEVVRGIRISGVVVLQAIVVGVSVIGEGAEVVALVRVVHAVAVGVDPFLRGITQVGSGRRTNQGSLYEDYLDQVRGYHTTEAYKKAIRKRHVWVEPMFAEAKAWHGVRRLRLRRLLHANIQGWLVAAGQNLTRLLAATGWGRRNAPCGNFVAIPRDL